MSVSIVPPDVTFTCPGCCATYLCDCTCCPDGYWTEYTFTIPTLTDGIACLGECSRYDGTWTVKYRGNCLWTTDEVSVTDDCIGNNFDVGDPIYQLTCTDGLFQLLGIYQTIQWLTSDGNFCIDGGTMAYSVYDLTAACFVVPSEDLVVTPGGVFVPCSLGHSGVGGLSLSPVALSGAASTTSPTYSAGAAFTVGHATLSGVSAFTVPTYSGGSGVTVGPVTISSSGTFTPAETGTGSVSIEGCTSRLPTLPDTLFLTLSDSGCSLLDGITISLARTSSTTFFGSHAVAGCVDCNLVTASLSCSGDDYTAVLEWTGTDSCAISGSIPGGCTTSTTVVSTTPFVITGRLCYANHGVLLCCSAGYFDWVLST